MVKKCELSVAEMNAQLILGHKRVTPQDPLMPLLSLSVLNFSFKISKQIKTGVSLRPFLTIRPISKI